MRTWPFPGDSTIAKARKMGLAYRELAKEQHRRAAELIEAFSGFTEKELEAMFGQEEAAGLHKALHGDHSDPVADLDRRFSEWGQSWHTETETSFGPDDYVNPKQAGALIQVTDRTIHTMRARGRIGGVFVPEKPGSKRGQWLFKVSDVYALSSEIRKRGWNLKKATDTVPDSGRGDAE